MNCLYKFPYSEQLADNAKECRLLGVKEPPLPVGRYIISIANKNDARVEQRQNTARGRARPRRRRRQHCCCDPIANEIKHRSPRSLADLTEPPPANNKYVTLIKPQKR
ncbi:hypothetical protein ACJJTC_012186 [Scirpophaga incertulas]